MMRYTNKKYFISYNYANTSASINRYFTFYLNYEWGAHDDYLLILREAEEKHVTRVTLDITGQFT